MNGHITLETMHDLLDGLVTGAEEVPLREHLRACAPCRQDFESLGAAVQALRDLPDAARAPEAIWSGIEARIGQGAEVAASDDLQVLTLPVSHRGPRRFTLTVSQLAAAAAVVSLLSATAVWTTLSNRGTPGPTAAAVASSPLGSPSARVVGLGETGYDEAVVRLQTIIEEGRDVLSPETVTTLETSLRTIDEAIAEVRDALAADPSSELLARLLANHRLSKLRVLRQAAISVQPRS